MAADDFDLAALSGYGSRRRRSSSRSSGGLTQAQARAFAKRLVPDVGSTEALAKIGEGGAQAARLLAQIEASDAPDSVKREARDRFERGGSNQSKSMLARAAGMLGGAVEGALQVIDKPKRAVIATLEEGLEELPDSLGGIREDSDTWADNVLRKRMYGGGDLVRKAVEDSEAKGEESAISDLLGSKWGGRAAGLVLDIGLDPLTYMTAGAATAAKKSGGELAEAAARVGGREAAEAAGRVGARGGAKVAAREVARRLGDEGLEEAASRVLRANSSLAATADELARAGLAGGLRLGGRTVLPQDVVRALGGRGVVAGKTGLAGTDTMAALRKVFGSNDELRTLLRAGDGVDPLRALRELDAARAGKLQGFRLAGQLGDQMNDLAAETRKLKISGENLADALRRGSASPEFQALDQATGGLVDRWAQWFERVRTSANEAAGREFIQSRENYVPRILSDEARAVLGGGADLGRPQSAAWFERGALKPGDEWMGVRLTGDTPIEDQLRSIARSQFGDDAVELFRNDLMDIAPAYLRGVQRRTGEEVTLGRLRDAGIISAQDPAGLDAVTQAARDLRDAGSPDALRSQASQVRARMGSSSDPTEIGLLRAEADQLDLDAALAESTARTKGAADVLERELGSGGRLWDPEVQGAVRAMIDAEIATQYRLFQLSPGNASTAQLAGGQLGEQIPLDTLERLLRAQQVAADPNKFLKMVDAANRGLKTYQLLTPGFHVRNAFGGVFNNAVAGVDVASYGRFVRALKAVRAGEQIGDTEALRAAQQIVDSGLLDDLNRVADMAENPNVRRLKDVTRIPNRKRLATDNPVTRLSRLTGDKVEDMMRGTLAFDRLIKGQSLDAAIDDVYKFHFDYSDLSTFEQGVVRRVIPFWTWTSRNLGRQVEFFLTNPKAYQRWNNTRDFFGHGGDSDPNAIPDYLQGPGTLDLGGGRFLQPGLPFEAADESLRNLTNPAAFLLQDASPLIKTPIEGTFDTQFFSNLPLSQKQAEPPSAWEKVPGLMPALQAVGWARKDRYGRYTMSGEDAYYVEQALPLLGRFRRLAPSEEKYQERALTSWLSFVGIGTRTADTKTQESEMMRRLDDLREMRDRAREAGYEIGEQK